eukprot:11523849-Heterocapsa_arctica.AAC.1
MGSRGFSRLRGRGVGGCRAEAAGFAFMQLQRMTCGFMRAPSLCRSPAAHSMCVPGLTSTAFHCRLQGRQSRSDPLGSSARMCGFGAAPCGAACP